MTELELLLRALASPTRLRILRILLQAGQADPQAAALNIATTPGDIARALGLRRSSISGHLKLLQRVGLVHFWKIKRHKFYLPCRAHRGSLRWTLLDRLRLELAPTDWPPPDRAGAAAPAAGPRPAPRGGVAAGPWGTLWSALTAFTHFRRLLMLHRLTARGSATPEQLCRAADLHPRTTRYHLRKLVRRGLLVGKGRLSVQQPSPSPILDFMTRLAQTLLAALPQDPGAGRPRAWP